MRHIEIIACSERRTIDPPHWAPAFRLVLCYGNVYEDRGKVYAQDKNLTFPTQAEADRWADAAAREWCVMNYSDWPISNEDEKQNGQ